LKNRSVVAFVRCSGSTPDISSLYDEKRDQQSRAIIERFMWFFSWVSGTVDVNFDDRDVE